MEDYKVLAKIIQDYPDALSERKNLQALFSDFFPQDRLKRNTLLMVFDDGIVSEMRGLTKVDQMDGIFTLIGGIFVLEHA